jgi:hypothetical protein
LERERPRKRSPVVRCRHLGRRRDGAVRDTGLVDRLVGDVLEKVHRMAGAGHELLLLEVVAVCERVVENVSGVLGVRLLVLVVRSPVVESRHLGRRRC